MDEILKKIEAELRERDGLIRSMSMYNCQKYSGARLKEIRDVAGYDDAAVLQASRVGGI